MTKKQRISLMANLWPDACEVQGWDEDDRDLRLRVCSIALSCTIKSIHDFNAALHDESTLSTELKSANEIDEDKGFTRVKALLLMLSDKLEGAMEVGHGEINKARQKRVVIIDLIKCLAIYMQPKVETTLDYSARLDAAENYVAEIIAGKFKRRLALEDLTIVPFRFKHADGRERKIPSQLDQLLFTLNSRLHNKRTGFRVKAGHSIHDMNRIAGVRCFCKQCVAARVDAEQRAVLTAYAGDLEP